MVVGLVGCADLLGADFDVQPSEPSQAGSGVSGNTVAASGRPSTGGVSGNKGGQVAAAEGGQAGIAGESREGVGGAAGEGGEGGASDEAGCNMPGDETSDCRNCGTLVTLPSGKQVCDCPSGTWGEKCEVVSEGIAVTGTQACVLRSDDSVSCWGWGSNTMPQGLLFKAVSGGDDHVCALAQEGTAHCWGQPMSGDAPARSFADLTSYGSQTCARTEEGYPVCWGFGAQPPDEALLQIQPAREFGCGLRVDGTMLCWGNTSLAPDVLEGKYTHMAASSYELCGITSPGEQLKCTESENFAMTPPTGSFKQVFIGTYHGCAIRTDGQVACWGNDDYGQVSEAPDGRFKTLALSRHSSCGVRTDGSVICWGDLAHTHQPGAPTGVFTALELTYVNTCALKVDGSVACWGFWHEPPVGAFKQVSTGYSHACGIRSDDTLACWGANDLGEADAPSGKFQRVSSGGFASCALPVGEGKARCWGSTFSSILQVPSDTFVDLSVGDEHACGLRTSGTIACWGENGDLLAAPEGKYKRIYAGSVHSCALRTSDSTAVCWGKSDPELDRGQLDPINDTAYVDLALGLFYSCGLRSDGGVECWGEDLGDATAAKDGPFVAIDAGQYTTCGLHPNGRLECWGGDVRPPQ